MGRKYHILWKIKHVPNHQPESCFCPSPDEVEKKGISIREKSPENSMVHHPSRGHGEPPFLPFKNDRPNFLDLLAAPILIRLFFYPL
jgi:hypothetical protein